MVKIIIAAFLILGFVSTAVASVRWKEKDEDEKMQHEVIDQSSRKNFTDESNSEVQSKEYK